MPVNDYGVWKANAVHYVVEHREDKSKNPHLLLYIDDRGDTTKHAYYHSRHRSHKPSQRNKEIPGLVRAVINIRSGEKEESRLAYWIDHNYNDHPIINSLTDLPLGFHPLADAKQSPVGLRTDYIRSNLFKINTGQILAHDDPNPENDIADAIEPEIEKAINEHADLYLFGARFIDFKGIHNLHMNQGNIDEWKHDDGVFQDGAILIHYPSSNRWLALFIGFASQAVHTDDSTGHAIASGVWSNYLSHIGTHINLMNSVTIDEASVNSIGSQPRRRSVTLTNVTNHKKPVSSWKIMNSTGEFQTLPADASLDAMASHSFDIPDVPLSDHGDTITLMNEQGLKVDGVSYRPQHERIEGQSVMFAH
ncbi:hypothetical protein N7504_008993 [Penicillium tannophilum]|nr:hypothetical protein N7504_008993 [Penicillium tannophilum]